MKLSQFRYTLPKDLFAEKPSKHRDEARLMVVHRKTGELEHKLFKDLIDCMINQTYSNLEIIWNIFTNS